MFWRVQVRRNISQNTPTLPSLHNTSVSSSENKCRSQVDVQKLIARDGCLSQHENDRHLVRDPQLYLRWTPIYLHPLPMSYEVWPSYEPFFFYITGISTLRCHTSRLSVNMLSLSIWPHVDTNKRTTYCRSNHRLHHSNRRVDVCLSNRC